VNALPAYTQHLDVCVMCYERNDYTKFIYPLKLHEYLAAGRPVVGSRISSLEEFQGTIALAESADEWSEALRESLTPESQGSSRVEARRAVAKRYDWDVLVHGVARVIAERLGADYRDRLARAGESIREARD
jgi:glycosyltransferase involved in cell wall biosynthesis